MLLVAATTGYQTRAFAGAGRRLGIELVLATDRCHILDDPWGDHAVPIRFEDLEGSAGRLDRLRVDGVVAVGDRPALIAARVAEKLALPFHPAAAVEAAGDKHLARERFAAAGLAVPEHYRISRDWAADGVTTGSKFYPCVLKPLGLSASRGVIRANNDREFCDAVARIRAILESPDIERLGEARDRLIQVEEFLEGREFAVEGLVTGGRLRTLAIFDKPDPLNGPYFEETIYVTPSRECPPVQAGLREAAQRAVTALGLMHGPVHAEMRATARGIFVLEAAARPIGGLCSRALKFAGGRTLEEMVLLHALGEDEGDSGEALAGGAMMIPIPKSGIYAGVDGVERASAVPGICGVAITAKEGQMLRMLPEGASYLGFIFAEGTEAEEALRAAHRELSFTIHTALSITQ